jgi:tetratricopeptide (TPR) repeat protein
MLKRYDIFVFVMIASVYSAARIFYSINAFYGRSLSAPFVFVSGASFLFFLLLDDLLQLCSLLRNREKIFPGHGSTARALSESMSPEVARGLSQFRQSLGRAGRLEEAIESFRAALQVRPDYAEAQASLSQALAEQRN